MGRKTLLTQILILAIGVGAITYALFYPKINLITPPYPNDTKMWNHIFAGQGQWDFNSTPKGAILPHHIVVASEINKFYKSLAKVASPKLFVIIGPNHYENGKANIQTCLNCTYKTTEGKVQNDKKLATLLIKNKTAAQNEKTFLNEHAIYSHAPFIKHYFPNAKILPIVFQWKTPQDEVDKTIDWLSKNLGNRDDVFFIASVDFSHYVTKEIADIHDESSFATISNFDFENMYDLEIDSPSSIYTITKLMDNLSNEKVKRFAHTNTQDLIKKKITRTTSHQFIGFFPREKNPPQKLITILILEEKYKNPTLGIVNSWDWRPENPIKFPELNSIRGEEDRFLMGFDYLVFDIPKECKTFSQNNVDVEFCPTTKDQILISFITQDSKITKKIAITEKNTVIIYKNSELQEKTL